MSVVANKLANPFINFWMYAYACSHAHAFCMKFFYGHYLQYHVDPIITCNSYT